MKFTPLRKLVKQAGLPSEVLGAMINPLNYYAAPVGALASLATPTYDANAIARLNNQGWLANMLAPGVAPYKLWKRIGYTVRSPEVEAGTEQLYRDEDEKVERRQYIESKRKEKAERNKPRLERTSDEESHRKAAGATSEILNLSYNPWQTVTSPVGGLAALLTPTYTAKDLARINEEGWVANTLFPGLSGYRFWKRLGATDNSPEVRDAELAAYFRDLPRREKREKKDKLKREKRDRAERYEREKRENKRERAPFLGTIDRRH